MVFSTLSPMSGRETIIAGTPGERPRFELPPVKPSIKLAVVAFSIVAVISIAELLVKLAVPSVFNEYQGPLIYGGDAPLALGALGFFSIAPVLLAILLAHIALRSDGEVPRGGRTLAGAALGLGYLNALWWLVRAVLALTSLQPSNNDYGQFLIYFFYWA
jgi:hypothetical protein